MITLVVFCVCMSVLASMLTTLVMTRDVRKVWSPVTEPIDLFDTVEDDDPRFDQAGSYWADMNDRPEMAGIAADKFRLMYRLTHRREDKR